jgi:hypothetical protein
MKKLIVSFVLVTLFLSIAGIGMVTANKANNAQAEGLTLPENAVEVSPGVFYLGESMDKGKVVEEYIFVHYAKGHEPVKKVKPTADEDYYSFISKDMEWKDVEEYYINPTNPYELTETFVVQKVNLAISEWEKEEYGNFNIFGNSITDNNVGFEDYNDGFNTISFGDFTTSGVIAVCRVSGVYRGPPSNREITEFDVMFDIDFKWGNATVDSTVMDLQNIATHELGHAVGLGDLYNPECSTQTMYGYSTEGDTEKRTLESGDIAGLNILYGI